MIIKVSQKLVQTPFLLKNFYVTASFELNDCSSRNIMMFLLEVAQALSNVLLPITTEFYLSNHKTLMAIQKFMNDSVKGINPWIFKILLKFCQLTQSSWLPFLLLWLVFTIIFYFEKTEYVHPPPCWAIDAVKTKLPPPARLAEGHTSVSINRFSAAVGTGKVIFNSTMWKRPIFSKNVIKTKMLNLKMATKICACS